VIPLLWSSVVLGQWGKGDFHYSLP
jgi:hypothetical protein